SSGDRITVTLIPKATEGLRLLQQRTSLSKTDLTNRAITLYEFVDDQLRSGHDIIARNQATGETQLVKLIVAPEAVAAGLAHTGTHPGEPRRPPGFLALRRPRRDGPGRAAPIDSAAGRSLRPGVDNLRAGVDDAGRRHGRGRAEGRRWLAGYGHGPRPGMAE